MKIVILVASLVLVGCSTSVSKVHLPDGREGISIQCTRSLQGCHQEAGNLCGPKGYDVINQTQSQTQSAWWWTGMGSAAQFDMLIGCKR